MRLLRTFAILLVVTLMLPWGAFSGKLAAMAQADVQAADGAITAAPRDTRDAARIDSIPKRCRTAILAGSPCVPDGVLAVARDIPRMTFARLDRPPTADHRLEGMASEADPDPPRPC